MTNEDRDKTTLLCSLLTRMHEEVFWSRNTNKQELAGRARSIHLTTLVLDIPKVPKSYLKLLHGSWLYKRRDGYLQCCSSAHLKFLATYKGQLLY